MPRKPKNRPMTAEEIVALTKQKRATSKLYKAEVKNLNNEDISQSVRKAISLIQVSESNGRISLDDTNTVRAVIGAYLESCASESDIPSIADIAAILGYSRNHIYYYMKHKANTDTGRFLNQVHDIIVSVLTDNALKGSVNNITAIFILKAMYGLREDDNTVLHTADTDVDDYEYSSGDYKKKYLQLIGKEH